MLEAQQEDKLARLQILDDVWILHNKRHAMQLNGQQTKVEDVWAIYGSYTRH